MSSDANLPRLVPAKKLREYLGVSRSAFYRLRRTGAIPGPLPGTRFYDLSAVNRSLDKCSDQGASQAARSAEDELIERARNWQNGRRAGRKRW